MQEIGGYIELDTYKLPMLHEGAIALNCGRNALVYLIRAKKIRKLWIPKFLCASIKEVCMRERIEVREYSIGLDFLPRNISVEEGEWVYIVNYYGQIDSSVIESLRKRYKHIVVDNAQAYFQMPTDGVDTLYTCRKFFGVVDGAFLYTDVKLEEEPERDESFERMRFLLGRFERTASEFYDAYVENNERFSRVEMKTMSKLTENLLHGIEYEGVKKRRTENFETLHEAFDRINRLKIEVPEGAFMYPLYIENGDVVRKKLQARNIYIPILWPDVFNICGENELEYDMAMNILPLPVDQRYSSDDMRYLKEVILNE